MSDKPELGGQGKTTAPEGLRPPDADVSAFSGLNLRLFGRALLFLALSEFSVAALMAMVTEVPVRPVGYLAFVVGLIALPVFLSSTYVAALRRSHQLTLFHASGVVRAFLGGPLLRSVRWLFLSVVLAIALVVGTSDANTLRLSLFLAPPALGAAYASAYMFLRSEVVAPYRRAVALRAALWLCPLLLIVLDFVCLLLMSDIPNYATLSDAVAAAIPNEPAKSAVVEELLRLNGYPNAIQAYALGRIGEWGGTWRSVAFLCMAALHMAFYSALARMVAPFLLPAAELRRGLLPSDGAVTPRPLSPTEIGVISALATVLIAFVVLPSLAASENWLRTTKPPSRYVKVIVEEIDGGYYRPGTIDTLEKLRGDTARALNIVKGGLQGAANAGFDQMAGNVDGYLDVYYSLPAEYMRIVGLVLGETELAQRMATDLNEALMTGAPFRAYDASMDAALKSDSKVRAIYADGVRKVLNNSTVDFSPDTRIEVVAWATVADMRLPVPTHNLTTTGTRAMAGSAAGGLVAALVTKKLVAKGVLKLASKAVAKAALSKSGSALGGAGVGAGAGAVVGSAVPALGTAVGAAIGGVVGGLGIGVGVDYLTLKLEESYARQSFKQEILAAIEAQRAAFLAQLAP